MLPGAQAPSPAGTQQKPAASAAPKFSDAPRPRAAPPFIKAAGEEGVLDRALKRHGKGGEASLKRDGAGFGLKLSVEGFQTKNLIEPCSVSFGEAPVRLTSLGKPAGSPRYKLEAPVCPMTFDVLNGSIFVIEPQQHCVVEAAGCRIDVQGMWGPEGASLIGQAGDFAKARAQAESAVRESYRLLIERADRANQKIIAREQAGFSSEREVACRNYLREPVHGYCHARFTEMRATDLRQRLGLKDEAPKPKPKPRPKPAAAAASPGPIPAPAPQ